MCWNNQMLQRSSIRFTHLFDFCLTIGIKDKKRGTFNDYNTMLNLFKSKDYHWNLFVGHLVIEELYWC